MCQGGVSKIGDLHGSPQLHSLRMQPPVDAHLHIMSNITILGGCTGNDSGTWQPSKGSQEIFMCARRKPYDRIVTFRSVMSTSTSLFCSVEASACVAGLSSRQSPRRMWPADRVTFRGARSNEGLRGASGSPAPTGLMYNLGSTLAAVRQSPSVDCPCQQSSHCSAAGAAP